MKKNNILIVEDDPNLGKILQDYLKLKGYKITLAVDGEDGLSKFSNNDAKKRWFFISKGY